MIALQEKLLDMSSKKAAMRECWSIYIDIEGFGALYKKEDVQISLALGYLLEGVYLVGSNCYNESPDRLFAHQTGDGFSRNPQTVPQRAADSRTSPASQHRRRGGVVGVGCV